MRVHVRPCPPGAEVIFALHGVTGQTHKHHPGNEECLKDKALVIVGYWVEENGEEDAINTPPISVHLPTVPSDTLSNNVYRTIKKSNNVHDTGSPHFTVCDPMCVNGCGSTSTPSVILTKASNR